MLSQNRGLVNIYTFHKRDESLESVVAIREGFSFYAFVFSILWPLYHRLWSMTTAYLIYYIVVGMLHEWGWIGKDELIAIHVGFLLLMGSTAYDWRRWSLKRQGYKLFDIIAGCNYEDALRRFLDRHTTSHNQTAEAS